LREGLLDVYRESHVFLHVSLTEGMPQVLLEAFASGLAVVATAVGGVAEAAGEAALLIGPDDADAAAKAVLRIAHDPELRRRLVSAGLQKARGQTLEAETARVAAFIKAHAQAA
jgi:glycosyltransferase involved in cell wall biosynthesis